MNARAFQEWIGRLALLAALMLVAVPTTGRLFHAAGGMAHTRVAQLALEDAHHVHAAPVGEQRAPHAPFAAPGDADCDYCPLLSSLVAAAGVATTPAALPRPAATPAGPAAPRLPWLHPSGLGSRGPPLFG